MESYLNDIQLIITSHQQCALKDSDLLKYIKDFQWQMIYMYLSFETLGMIGTKSDRCQNSNANESLITDVIYRCLFYCMIMTSVFHHSDCDC